MVRFCPRAGPGQVGHKNYARQDQRHELTTIIVYKDIHKVQKSLEFALDELAHLRVLLSSQRFRSAPPSGFPSAEEAYSIHDLRR